MLERDADGAPMTPIGRADSRPLLASIKVPTVIVVGDTDPLTSAALSG